MSNRFNLENEISGINITVIIINTNFNNCLLNTAGISTDFQVIYSMASGVLIFQKLESNK